MRIRTIFKAISGLSVLFSSAVLAHPGNSAEGLTGDLLHMLTGEHLLMLILVGVFAVCVSRLYHRFR